MSDGFDFLGFHIQWRRKKGTNKSYVYTFIAQPTRPVGEGQDPCPDPQNITADPWGPCWNRINQILRGWTAYFRHAVASRTFDHLQKFVWWRIVALATHTAPLEMGRRPTLAHRTLPGGGTTSAPDGITLFNPAAVPITALPLPGQHDPHPLDTRCLNHPYGRFRGEPGCGESRTSGSAGGLGKRARSNPGTAPQADPTCAVRRC